MLQFFGRSRLFFAALLITMLLVIGAAMLISFSRQNTAAPSANQVLAQQIANSTDECVVCHTTQTPGIVNQYALSAHFVNNVSCASCHKTEQSTPGATKHPDADFFVLREPTSTMCQTCHNEQVQQFYLSRHALPSYVAYAGTEGLSEDELALYHSIPEGGADPTGKVKARNAIHQLEGTEFTAFTCESCHDVGAPQEDGSIGECSACHLRHEFSLEQVRKPETCNQCHIGPDHPQWEIYTESGHGVAYMTGGDDWNWDAEPGSLTTADFPAPTCATCHFSGFGNSATTHDVGDRLGWFLAAPITTERPNFAENRLRMQNVCMACHSDEFIIRFYTQADTAVLTVNDFVKMSDAMVQPLKDNKLLTAAPFDEPIDYVYYELWHHFGRTAKSGVWMQGPDYAQWHGVYEVLKKLAELRELVDEKLVANGLPPLELPEGFPSIESARAYLKSLEKDS